MVRLHVDEGYGNEIEQSATTVDVDELPLLAREGASIACDLYQKATYRLSLGRTHLQDTRDNA